MNDVCLKKMPRKIHASRNDYMIGDFRILLIRNFTNFVVYDAISVA
jgi:hypothetical protein